MPTNASSAETTERATQLLEATNEYILWFSDLGIGDIPRVGGKNAALGEMFRELTAKGVRVPNGFAVTSAAYRVFLSKNNLIPKLRSILEGINVRDLADLAARGQACRDAIVSAPIPEEVTGRIVESYRHLRPAPRDVAVRSSATAEDLPTASFAGLHESYLNIRGEQAVLHACHRCYASLFTDRAISYRVERSFDHLEISLSIGIQEMVRSDKAASGVMFSIDTETGFKDAILINGAYGLGENIVKGVVSPDEFFVFKPTLRSGHRPILKKRIGAKEIRMIYEEGAAATVRNFPVAVEDRQRTCISDDEVLDLARWGCQIEAHFSQRAGHLTPMDIEWAKDGTTGQLFILQARPGTVHTREHSTRLTQYLLKTKELPIVTGASVGESIAQGPVRTIKTVHDLDSIKQGEILVAEKTEPDWEPAMKKTAAIITDHGGRTCHAAIVSREIGIPAVVGTQTATAMLQTGDVVTVSCAEGEQGRVYKGRLPFEIRSTELSSLPTTRTALMVNIADPGQAFKLSSLPCQGAGLVRIEFIISSHISVHPQALLEFERVTSAADRKQISDLTKHYSTKADYFVDKLAEGVAMIAAAFYPREVIVRFSDFKTNEYAGLLGGAAFEPHEENPMIGFRGASRYYRPSYRQSFGLECAAIKKVREVMGLTNVKVMIPFCRTVAEGERVLEEMGKNGLVRGKHGLEVYVMCEIPSNVILASEFAKIFDGFSIGSNDLTQLILGLDRDSEIVASLFDERNKAVTSMIAQAIEQVHRAGSKIGICGQAPSDYPEFAKFLVAAKIDSISLNPDSLLRTILTVADAEKQGE